MDETNSNKVLSCLHLPIWDKLLKSKKVLIAGCGGGYDIFSGLPLYFALEKAGIQPYLSNLSFTLFQNISGKRISPQLIEVTSESSRTFEGWSAENEFYWPEFFLSKWFKEKEGKDVPIYMMERSAGVKSSIEGYEKLVNDLNIDTIIVVDGGTDSLMRGNESGLGTPTEDMTTISAVSQLSHVNTKLLLCLGMGVDHFHGVSHHHFLENVADLASKGGFYGSFSLMGEMEEAQKYKEAYLACQPENSIVCSSIVSAVEGKFGDHHSKYTSSRTQGSKLYISSLMNLYWSFDLMAVARNVEYLDKIKNTKDANETRQLIMKHRARYHNQAGEYIGDRKEMPLDL